jgi:hypothetical protein
VFDWGRSRLRVSSHLRGVSWQIKEREEALREAEREAQRDKERIDAIIAQVNNEDRMEMEERLRRKVRVSVTTSTRGGGGGGGQQSVWRAPWLMGGRGVWVCDWCRCRRTRGRCCGITSCSTRGTWRSGGGR